jgi:acetyl esterase/lipase
MTRYHIDGVTYEIHGTFSHVMRSVLRLWASSGSTVARRVIGQRLVDSWPWRFEAGVVWMRGQFDRALSFDEMSKGRAYLDSVGAYDTPVPNADVTASAPGEPVGSWFTPRTAEAPRTTMLYCHGGGYTFYMRGTRQFIASLAERLGVAVFAVDYRLTPEHPHPAQLDDGLAAYRWLLERGIDPTRLVICGDSAGGHLTLMLLTAIRDAGLPQPALALGISPWTDTGRCGESEAANDRYDLVSSAHVRQYGNWLRGTPPVADQDISPIAQDYTGLAPIYLQAGGREVLLAMIRDFARQKADEGANIRLDVWPDMQHVFQYTNAPEARDAVTQLGKAIAAVLDQTPVPTIAQTDVGAGFKPARV